MRVLHATHSAVDGGAARAVARIHHALLSSGTESRLLVSDAPSNAPFVIGPSSKVSTLRTNAAPHLESMICRLQRPHDSMLRSAAVIPSWSERCIRRELPDVVHLHWVGRGFLSVRQVGRIAGGAVWTLHDMWPFCGAEHYADDGPNARWRTGYSVASRDSRDRGIDVDRWTWKRKKSLWNEPKQVVAPTKWLQSCATSSSLFSDWPVRVIPHPLPVDLFAPQDKRAARKALGLPMNSPIILYGAASGTRDPIKGWDLLVRALAGVRTVVPDAMVVMFGEATPTSHNLPLMHQQLGQIGDDRVLATAYSAADVMVVPSRQEAFGQTASEAQACGIPVVAFDTSGLSDVVAHRATGFLATPFSAADLGKGIAWILSDQRVRDELGGEARQRALRLWSPAAIAAQYNALYEEVAEGGTA